MRSANATADDVVRVACQAVPVSCRGDLPRPCGSVIEAAFVRGQGGEIGLGWVGVVVEIVVAVLAAVKVY